MLRILLAVMASFALLAPAARAQTPPIEAYAALPAISMVEVSPDGSTLAYLRRDGASAQVTVQTRTGEVLAAVETGILDINGLQWISPDHVAVSWTSTEHFPLGGFKGRFQLIDILNVRTRSYVRALKTADHNAFSSIGQWRGGVYRGRPVLYASAPTYEQGDFTYDVYRVDPDTGRGTRLTRGDSDTDYYVLNAEGEPTARVAYQSDNGFWRLSARTGMGWREIYREHAPLDRPGVFGMGATADSVILDVKKPDGGRVATEIALADGAVRQTFDLDRDIDFFFHDNRGLLVGLGYTDVFQEYRFFEPRLQAAYDAVREVLPGRQLVLSSYSDDFGVVAFYVSGTGETGGYYLYDAVAKRLSLVGRVHPGIPAGQQSEVRIVRYTAADGRPLFGYLTVPNGREALNLPIVMLPHGGPESRDVAGFDGLSQGLATRGYAVFQPQFRGSSGFGQEFLEAGYGEWGRKMQTDISDGLRYLVDQGVADPERACIVGWSYGGYAALAGMTVETGLYRCAVAVAPVSDLRAMLADEERRSFSRGDDNDAIRYWKRFMGAEGSRDASLDARSPARLARLARGATGPVLLIHGRDDTVVPFSQSTMMLEALGGEGPKAHLVAFDGQNHDLSGREERLRMLTETLRFLEAHNPAN